MGIMAGVLVYVIWEWKDFCRPLKELSKVLFIIAFFLFLGMFPYVDNFAHLGGLIAGFLLGVIFAPYYPIYDETLSKEYKKIDNIKLKLIAISAPTFVVIYSIFFILFYEVQPNCYICQYFTCIPFTDTICQDRRPTPDHGDIDVV